MDSQCCLTRSGSIQLFTTNHAVLHYTDNGVWTFCGREVESIIAEADTRGCKVCRKCNSTFAAHLMRAERGEE